MRLGSNINQFSATAARSAVPVEHCHMVSSFSRLETAAYYCFLRKKEDKKCYTSEIYVLSLFALDLRNF